MRWLAVHLPLLPLEIFSRSEVQQHPLALHERRQGVARIRLCNSLAAAAGVLPGMSADAARAVDAGVRILERRPQAEREALFGLAEWAGRFTPMLVAEPPRGLLLEVESSLRLFGGVTALRQQVREGLADLGFQARLCQAPTAIGAWLLVRAGVEEAIDDPDQLRGLLRQLPLSLLPLRPSKRKLLQDLGLQTFGELLRLPRQGLRQRLGAPVLDYLERALGEQPDPRAPFKAPPHFRRRLELPCETADQSQLLHAAGRLLEELGGYLIARQLGTRRLQWQWFHEREQQTAFHIGQREAARDPAVARALLAEYLQRTPLSAPVREIELRVDQFEPLGGRAQLLALFPEEQEGGGEREAELLDRLRVRLGADALKVLAPVREHRPEMTTPNLQHGTLDPPLPPRRRPLWLLQPPQPLDSRRGIPYRGGRLLLEAERERIDTGWWDGHRVRRDYFIAHSQQGEQLWIYRDLAEPGGWYLHGVFG